MTESRPLLVLDKVVKSYDSPTGSHTPPVLVDVTLELMEGESLAVVGPSGSGKSTLLDIMGGLDRASSGQVRMADRDLSNLAENDLARIRNQEIGFVFQGHHLLRQFTVFENVLAPCLMLKDPIEMQAREKRAHELLERVGLGRHRSHRPGQLSGGERQRVAVVRALINQPRLLLADEPTGSLDRSASREMTELLVELNQSEGVAMVVVTHAMELASTMDRVMELRDGALSPLEEER